MSMMEAIRHAAVHICSPQNLNASAVIKLCLLCLFCLCRRQPPDRLTQSASLPAAVSSWLAAMIRSKSVNDLTTPCNPTCLRMFTLQASTVAQISVADSVASYDVELLTGTQAEQVCSRELDTKPELPSPPGATQYAPLAVMHQ